MNNPIRFRSHSDAPAESIRRRVAHRAFIALSAVVVGGMATLGFSAPSFAALPTTVMTFKIVSKAGAAIAASEVWALQDDAGVEPYGDTEVKAAAVTGKPGYFTATLDLGATYTLAIAPTGAAALDGNGEFMGGTQDLTQAQTFVPSATNTFVTATFAAEGVITGKVTSPTGVALNKAEVDTFVFDGGQWVEGSYALTNAAGVYTLTDLAPGSYVLKFFSATGAYPAVYSGGAASIDSATPVLVLPNKPATANVKFSAYTGSFTGNAQIDYDGYDFGDQGAVVTAYPVLTMDGSDPATINFGRSISSAVVGDTGAWSIANVPPGNYVVDIDPGYYNEAPQWVGTSDPSEPLADATIYSVSGTQKVATGTTYLSSNDYEGAQPDIYVSTAGNVGVSGAFVSLVSDEDGYEYASGVTDGSVDDVVQLSYSDGASVDYDLQPGWYTITVVSPNNAYEPYTLDTYLGFGDSYEPIVMQAAAPAPSFTSQPTIAQTDLQVGTTYTVSGQVAARSDAALTYQWLRNGKPIYDAVGTSYTSTGADLGAQLSVRVEASSFGFDPVYATADVQGGVETTGPAPTNNGTQPSISPATGAFVGTVLQASVGGWSDTGLHFDYQWQSNGVNVGTDSSTYTVAATDIGEPVTVDITATKTGYDPSAPAVSSVAVVPAAHPAPLATKVPVVTKTLVKGVTTYSATPGTWSIAGFTYSYSWSLAGTPTPLGTSAKLVETGASTWADPLELTVIASRSGYLSGTSTIIVQKGTNAFTETIAPTVHDTEGGFDVSDSDVAVQVGQHLVVSAPANWTVEGDITPNGYSYQWYRQSTAVGKLPVAIAGATSSTYLVGLADIGQLLSVKETTVSTTYTAASIIAAAGLGSVSQLLVTNPATVSITGFAAQGQVLSAVPTAWPTTAVVDSYQWLDCPSGGSCDSSNPTTYLPIAKATTAKLTVLASYGNIAVRVTGSKAGYVSEPVYSTAASTDPATDIVTLAAPTLSGTTASAAHVGVKLTAVSGRFSVASLVASYVWQVQECAPTSCDPNAWTQASGTTANTVSYVPNATDFGAGDWSIRVQETVTRTGYTASAPDDSAAVAIDPGTITVTKAPALATTVATYGITAGTTSPVSTAAVQWYDDSDTSDTATTWTRNAVDDAGKAIYADITYTLAGYTPVVRQVLAQRGTQAAPDPETVTGAVYGDLLGVTSANPFSDAAGTTITPTYQWYSNGVAIAGATASTFRPSSAYIGHYIQAKVTGSTALYNPASIETPHTFVLGTGGLGDLTAPSITYPGTLEPGTVMTSVPGTGYIPTAVTIARQWQRSADGGTTWVNVAKATAVTYAPLATDVGAEFRVEVVSSKVGYATQTQYSEAETVQYSPTLATIVAPSVTGTPDVGDTLTANPGTWNATALIYTYQWYRDDVAIPGATASTFIPDFSFATDTLSFTVTASRVGYQPVTVTSNDQVIGLGTITPTLLPKIAHVGVTYTIPTGSWAVDGLTFSYQWEVAGVDATGVGATTDTYTPVGTDAGTLTVVITATRTGYTPYTTTITWATALKAAP